MDQQGKRMSGLDALVPHGHKTTTSSSKVPPTTSQPSGHSGFSFLSPLHQVFNPKKKTAEEKAAEDRSRENSMYLGRNFARAKSSFMPLKPARPARDIEVAPNPYLSGSIGTKPKQPSGKLPYKAGSASQGGNNQQQQQQQQQNQPQQLQNQSYNQNQQEPPVYNNTDVTQYPDIRTTTQGQGEIPINPFLQQQPQNQIFDPIATTTTSTITAASMDMSFDSPSASSSIWKDTATPWKDTNGNQYEDTRDYQQQQQPQQQQYQPQPSSYDSPQIETKNKTTLDSLIPLQYTSIPTVTMPTIATTSFQETQPSNPILPPRQDKFTAHIDPNSGHTYYYNAETGVSTWEKPDGNTDLSTRDYIPALNAASSSGGSGSPGGKSSNSGPLYTPARSVIRAPLPRLTCPHGKIKPLRGGMVDEGESYLDIDGRWRSQSFTGDASIFTKGIGKNLFIGAKITKIQFLSHREGVVRWYRRLKEEEFWKDVDDDGEPVDHVQILVQKFTNILEVIEMTGSASGVRGEGFAFDKVYAINDKAYFYHPKPSARSPFKHKGLHNAGDLLDRHKEAFAKGNPRDILAEMHRMADLDDEMQARAAEQQALELKAMGLGLGPHAGQSRQPGQCDKQIAREKLFLTEVFMPLGQQDLSDELLEFIKSEITRELNTKIVNLYEDEELSIIDKDTFDRALSAYLRTEKLHKHMNELRDSLLKFVKDNMPPQ